MEFSFKVIIGLVFVVIGLGIIFNFNVGKYLFPAILIVIGLSMLFGQNMSWNNGSVQTSKEGKIEATSVFSSVNRKIESENFKGGQVDVVFGGGEIDFTKAKMVKGEPAEMEVNAVFGGVEIIVPENWTVNSSITGVFGGVENTAKVPAQGKEQGRLNLKGAAVFGGVTIKN